MSVTILDAARNSVVPQKISEISLLMAEKEEDVSKALSGIFPTVLSGFIAKANDSKEHAEDILDIVKTIHDNRLIEKSVFKSCHNFTMEKGHSLMKAIFGENLNCLESEFASFASIRTRSSGMLFGLGGMAMADALGKTAEENNFDKFEFATFLVNQKTLVLDKLPGGLWHITGLLRLRNMDREGKSPDTAIKVAQNEIVTGWRRKVLVFLVIIILLLSVFMIWW